MCLGLVWLFGAFLIVFFLVRDVLTGIAAHMPGITLQSSGFVCVETVAHLRVAQALNRA